MYDLQLRKVITSLSELRFGVLRLYGNPIKSRFHPFTCEGQWVLELAGKGMSGRAGQVGWPSRSAYSCVTSNFGRS